MDRKDWNTDKFKGLDHEIGDAVERTVERAISEVHKVIGSIQYNVKPVVKKFKKNQITYAYQPIGKVSGMILQTFGMIGSLGLGIAILVLGVVGLSIGGFSAFTIPVGIMLPLFGASLIMQSRGSTLRNRYKRFDKYLHIIGNRHFVELYEMMELSGFSYKYVVKDLKKMIRIGMFPQASIDTEDGMLYLSRGGYEQYRYLTGHTTEPQAEQEGHKADTGDEAGIKDDNLVARMGRDYIQRINDLRVKLKDTETVNKIIHMEAVLIKIVEYIEKHPDQKEEVRRLMDYYLPMTIKLLSALYDFEQQPVQGENILSTRQEIKETLDTINIAFEKLLDQLFKDLAWDISTDISVMETMLAQEGLTENTMNQSKTMGE